MSSKMELLFCGIRLLHCCNSNTSGVVGGGVSFLLFLQRDSYRSPLHRVLFRICIKVLLVSMSIALTR